MSGLFWFILLYFGGKALWRRYQQRHRRGESWPPAVARGLEWLQKPLALYHGYYAILLMLFGAGWLLGALALVIGGIAAGHVGPLLGGGLCLLMGRWLWRLGRRIGREELAILRGQAHPLAAKPIPKNTPPQARRQPRAIPTQASAARTPQSPILHKKKTDKQFEQL